MKTYEVITVQGQEVIQCTNEDGILSFIPKDESNSDYQRYLNPEAEQSTPIVKDEPAAKK
jgi:hypothetical protein